ncbi:MAG: class I poly(R)-hydroxyalkanoic acid synthase, partial [Planktotalea arctica]
MTANLEKIEALSERLIKAVSGKSSTNPALSGPDQELFSNALNSYWHEMMQNPAKMFEHQAAYWGKSVKHYVEAQQDLSKGKLEAPSDAFTTDKRFSNPLWNTHPYFNFVKQQYLINAEAIAQAVEDLDSTEKQRLKYFSQQIIDMMAPTNFLGT